ncbi:hypothetical protein ANCCAN_04851, partial [Ancylostoma caninum]
LIRRGSHELRIQEHLAQFKQASAKTFRTWNGESRRKIDEGRKLPEWSSVEKFEAHKSEVLTRQGGSKHREEEGSGEGVTTTSTTSTTFTTSTTSTTQTTTTSEILETSTQSSLQDDDQCTTCPSLFMDHKVDGRQLCSNWDHVQVIMKLYKIPPREAFETGSFFN